MQVLGIDVGGTGIKVAVVETTTGEMITERVRVPTPRPATPEAIGAVLKELVTEHKWTGPVGIGFPAAIQRGIARTAANVHKSFIGLPIAEFFSAQTGCRVFVANDADAAGMAEMRFGAGKGNAGVVLIITIGTGLGTAVFIDGHLLPNTELGHVYLDNGVEAERYASEAVRVTKGLKWKEWGKRFDHYLTTMEALLWPDLIILGGGVSDELHKFSPMITTKAPVIAASFLNQAGIVGAALFAEECLHRDK
ncbi:polyphosphate--glucose phosphotransferase [Propionivibrio soli]|uniref:polyphosphate--glucose phosphotransferase n=1 Tax=Propionivibrio soli TaxID=2976531 RepID=UPI0021E77D3D